MKIYLVVSWNSMFECFGTDAFSTKEKAQAFIENGHWFADKFGPIRELEVDKEVLEKVRTYEE